MRGNGEQEPLLTRVIARIRRLSRSLRGGPSTNSTTPEVQEGGIEPGFTWGWGGGVVKKHSTDELILKGLKPNTTYRIEWNEADRRWVATEVNEKGTVWVRENGKWENVGEMLPDEAITLLRKITAGRTDV